MGDIVLKIENVSKQYRLGLVGTGTLGDDLKRWWHLVRGKEDPFLKLGEVNNREVEGGKYVLALNNINLEIKKGEVIGIIGKNGAGKSTLLKLLSQVTTPTTGVIKVKGRIAALLEVGTGFHPELTGRENVYLNGAILGMSKKEIASKMDEIVEFSGVAKYLDTPVKRYSSGMTVRLGFAVAAHLEPDILIVDEVLAVGDAEFQKKCIGKMKDVAGQGRTVLFVSHNMSTINSLCEKSILLDKGQIYKQGLTSEVVPFYLASTTTEELKSEILFDLDETKAFQILGAKLVNVVGDLYSEGVVPMNDEYFIEIDYLFRETISKCHLTLIIKNSSGEIVLFLDRTDFYNAYFLAKKGRYTTRVKIQNPLLKPGVYYLTIGLADEHSDDNDHRFDVLKFGIENLKSLRETRAGDLYLPTEWEMKELS